MGGYGSGKRWGAAGSRKIMVEECSVISAALLNKRASVRDREGDNITWKEAPAEEAAAMGLGSPACIRIQYTIGEREYDYWIKLAATESFSRVLIFSRGCDLMICASRSRR